MKKIMIGSKPNGITRLSVVLGLSFFLSLMAMSDDGDNLLVNGDFSKGADGWGGDAGNDTSATDISAPLSGPGSTTGGTVIHLKDAIATRIYQSFESKSASLVFILVCTPSADCKFTGEGKVAKVATDIQPEPATFTTYPTPNLMRTVPNPNYDVYMAGFRSPILIIEDRDNDQVFTYPIHIDSSNATQQKVTIGVEVQIRKDYKIFIAFPPGEGSISLASVSLTKGAADPSGAPVPPGGSPFQH